MKILSLSNQLQGKLFILDGYPTPQFQNVAIYTVIILPIWLLYPKTWKYCYPSYMTFSSHIFNILPNPHMDFFLDY